MSTRTRVAGFGLCTMFMVGVVAIGPVEAFNPQPDPPGCAPVGVTEQMSAELLVGYSKVAGIQPTPFRVGLGIYDALGRLVAHSVERVDPGHVVSLQVSGAEMGLRGRDRSAVYAVVQCLGNAARRVLCAQSLNSSFEVFDAGSGETQVNVPVTVAVVPVLGSE